MNKISISNATKADTQQLIDWFDWYKIDDQRKKRVDCFLNHHFTILAKEGHKLVGVLQWLIKEDAGAGVVEIEEVLVLEDYRGQKIGAKLVEFCIKEVREYFKKIKIIPRKMCLCVGKDNTPAVKLYEKFGFKHVADLGTLFDDDIVESFYVLRL